MYVILSWPQSCSIGRNFAANLSAVVPINYVGACRTNYRGRMKTNSKFPTALIMVCTMVAKYPFQFQVITSSCYLACQSAWVLFFNFQVRLSFHVNEKFNWININCISPHNEVRGLSLRHFASIQYSYDNLIFLLKRPYVMISVCSFSAILLALAVSHYGATIVVVIS